MTSLDPADGEEPLDPAAERLRRKLVRLLFISGGIMMLGLIAVFAGIVYKLNNPGPEAARLSAERPVEAAIAIPPGARIVSTALDGDRALITLTHADGTSSLVLVELRSGQVLGRYAFIAE